jgi:hypothetical protein
VWTVRQEFRVDNCCSSSWNHGAGDIGSFNLCPDKSWRNDDGWICSQCYSNQLLEEMVMHMQG